MGTKSKTTFTKKKSFKTVSRPALTEAQCLKLLGPLTARVDRLVQAFRKIIANARKSFGTFWEEMEAATKPRQLQEISYSVRIAWKIINCDALEETLNASDMVVSLNQVGYGLENGPEKRMRRVSRAAWKAKDALDDFSEELGEVDKLRLELRRAMIEKTEEMEWAYRSKVKRSYYSYFDEDEYDEDEDEDEDEFEPDHDLEEQIQQRWNVITYRFQNPPCERQLVRMLYLITELPVFV
ncbi:hypothetical protein CJU90_1771 [Yarrowia sp. C11]|nr:hypothetical protein CKK34_0498 [Yarrowia sp. E02]KAG5371710.1 hypothetical protein CJU90_1771 [Yarrowia sp. C11]